MIRINNDLACCGVREIENLSTGRLPTARVAMLHFCAHTLGGGGNQKFAYAFFTQAGQVKYKYGDEFAAFILKHKLGTVTTPGKTSLNPNSKRRVKFFIWAIRWKNLNKWMTANAADINPLKEEYEDDYDDFF